MPTSPYSCFTFTVGGGGLLMVNLMLTLSCRSLQEIVRAIRNMQYISTERASCLDTALLNPSCCAFADLLKVYRQFSPPLCLRPCDVNFPGLHGRLPSAHYFIPFEINSVSFAPTHCGLPWIPLPNGWLVHEFVYEC